VQHPIAQEAIRSYTQVDVHSDAAYASSHRLIQMLLDNVLNKIAAAKGYMLRGTVPDKCENISRAVAIVEGLRLCLDTQAGGDIARNLEDLYDYVERRLVQANMKNDPALLDEVASLLGEIKAGWTAIGDQVANVHTMPAHSSPSDVPVVG